MIKKLNFQYVLSYLGLIPFLILIFDKYFLYKIKEEIVINFLIYYLLIIFVFVGSINWNLKVKLKLHIIIYGFLPSLFTTIIIVVNFYYFNQLFILLAIILLILVQLLTDYLIIYIEETNKHPFFYLRLPLTLIIILCSLIIIS